MLHIILLILKIIGIILLVILGILVLLACIILFSPIKYKGNAYSTDNIDSLHAEVKGSWIFHLISFYVHYEKNKFIWNVRIGWKKIRNNNSINKTKEETRNGQEENRDNKKAEEAKSTGAEKREEPPEKIQKAEKSVQKLEKKEQEELNQMPAATTDAEKESRNKWESIFRKIKSIIGKIYDALQNIKCTFEKICDKINAIGEKKEELTSFITDEIHKKAFFLILKKLKHLLWHWRPKRFIITLKLGFEDPYLTGKLFALYSVAYPYISKQSDFTPDFENPILDGTIETKGKIRMIHLAIAAWILFWNKQVRTTYSDFKNLKFKV